MEVRSRFCRDVNDLRGRPAPELQLNKPVLMTVSNQQADFRGKGSSSHTVVVCHPSTDNQLTIAVIASFGMGSSDGVVRLFA